MRINHSTGHGLCNINLTALHSYNSVFIKHTVGWKYIAVAGRADFAQGADFSAQNQVEFGQLHDPVFYDQNTTRDFMASFQQDVVHGRTERLSWQDCISAFEAGPIAKYDAVLASSTVQNSSHPIGAWTAIDAISYTPSLRTMASWLCLYSVDEANKDNNMEWWCDPEPIKSNSSGWILNVGWGADSFYANTHGKPTLLDQPMPVDHCQVRRNEAKCSIKIHMELLGVVVICNVIKIACFAWLLFRGPRDPLVTAGDVTASFLSDPDPYGARWGPISAKQLEWRNEVAWSGKRKPFKARRRYLAGRQASALPGWRWEGTMLL